MMYVRIVVFILREMLNSYVIRTFLPYPSLNHVHQVYCKLMILLLFLLSKNFFFLKFSK